MDRKKMDELKKTDLLLQTAEVLYKYPLFRYRKSLESEGSYRVNVALVGENDELRSAFETNIRSGAVMHDTEVVITYMKNEKELMKHAKEENWPDYILCLAAEEVHNEELIRRRIPFKRNDDFRPDPSWICDYEVGRNAFSAYKKCVRQEKSCISEEDLWHNFLAVPSVIRMFVRAALAIPYKVNTVGSNVSCREFCRRIVKDLGTHSCRLTKKLFALEQESMQEFLKSEERLSSTFPVSFPQNILSWNRTVAESWEFPYNSWLMIRLIPYILHEPVKKIYLPADKCKWKCESVISALSFEPEEVILLAKSDQDMEEMETLAKSLRIFFQKREMAIRVAVQLWERTEKPERNDMFDVTSADPDSRRYIEEQFPEAEQVFFGEFNLELCDDTYGVVYCGPEEKIDLRERMLLYCFPEQEVDDREELPSAFAGKLSHRLWQTFIYNMHPLDFLDEMKKIRQKGKCGKYSKKSEYLSRAVLGFAENPDRLLKMLIEYRLSNEESLLEYCSGEKYQMMDVDFVLRQNYGVRERTALIVGKYIHFGADKSVCESVYGYEEFIAMLVSLVRYAHRMNAEKIILVCAGDLRMEGEGMMETGPVTAWLEYMHELMPAFLSAVRKRFEDEGNETSEQEYCMVEDDYGKYVDYVSSMIRGVNLEIHYLRYKGNL